MSAPIFIGDEVTAAGYRLGGARVLTPRDDELREVFRRALEDAELVLIGIEFARKLPTAELKDAVLGLDPKVLVVSDISARIPMRNMAQRMRAELGMGP